MASSIAALRVQVGEQVLVDLQEGASGRPQADQEGDHPTAAEPQGLDVEHQGVLVRHRSGRGARGSR